MTLNLLKKGMTLGSKYDVEVLIVVLNKATGIFQEFCTADSQQLFTQLLAAKLALEDVQSYTLQDLPSVLREDCGSEASPKPRKKARNESPAPSDVSSQVSSSMSAPSRKPRISDKRSTHTSDEKGVPGYLAMLLKNPVKKPPPTLSTADSLPDPVPAPPSPPPKVDEDDFEEDSRYSPSDLLVDP